MRTGQPILPYTIIEPTQRWERIDGVWFRHYRVATAAGPRVYAICDEDVAA